MEPLPDAWLSRVFTFLEIKDTLTLPLVCKRWNRLVEKKLYGNYAQSCGSSFHSSGQLVFFCKQDSIKCYDQKTFSLQKSLPHSSGFYEAMLCVEINHEDTLILANEKNRGSYDPWSYNGDRIEVIGIKENTRRKICCRFRPRDVAYCQKKKMIIIAKKHCVEAFAFDSTCMCLRQCWGCVSKKILRLEVREPLSVTFDDKLGKILVTDSNDMISMYSDDGHLLKQIGSYGDAEYLFNEPRGIIVDDKSDIYVVDFGNK